MAVFCPKRKSGRYKTRRFLKTFLNSEFCVLTSDLKSPPQCATFSALNKSWISRKRCRMALMPSLRCPTDSCETSNLISAQKASFSSSVSACRSFSKCVFICSAFMMTRLNYSSNNLSISLIRIIMSSTCSTLSSGLGREPKLLRFKVDLMKHDEIRAFFNQRFFLFLGHCQNYRYMTEFTASMMRLVLGRIASISVGA